MSILLDHHLQEQMPHSISTFPVAFYCDELAALPDRVGPMHWHPYMEIATARNGVVDYQVGQSHAMLEPGDSIFVNHNMLHRIRQVSGAEPDHLPVVVFSGTVVAPEHSVIYQRYIRPILLCESLPFAVFRHNDERWNELRYHIQATYLAMHERPGCYELTVQRSICHIMETIFRNLDSLPKTEASRLQLTTQIRLQKMLSYIYEHYAEPITLSDIADAANISRSEAGRCFQSHLGCSPVEMLIQHRLQMAYHLLQETALSLQEISSVCGFHSTTYFSRQFRNRYGYPPGRIRNLGK